MKTKDCFYGQVRAITETHNGTSTIITPSALEVTNQMGITWDNETGMNPLWYDAPVPTEYTSYGCMLRTATNLNSSYALAHLEKNQPDDYYHKRIIEDYNNDYSMLCMTLAPQWGLHRILSQPDVLDYDYITARQFDTWYNFPATEWMDERIQWILSDEVGGYTHRVSPNKKSIPLVYAMNQPGNKVNFPIIGNIESCFLLLNREAVKILKDNYFKWAMNEMDIAYSRVGYSRFLRGNPGNTFYKVFAKNDIHVIDIAEYNICQIKGDWSSDCKDFSRVERVSDN